VFAPLARPDSIDQLCKRESRDSLLVHRGLLVRGTCRSLLEERCAPGSKTSTSLVPTALDPICIRRVARCRRVLLHPAAWRSHAVADSCTWWCAGFVVLEPAFASGTRAAWKDGRLRRPRAMHCRFRRNTARPVQRPACCVCRRRCRQPGRLVRSVDLGRAIDPVRASSARGIATRALASRIRRGFEEATSCQVPCPAMMARGRFGA
jgi:hypothetical protein